MICLYMYIIRLLSTTEQLRITPHYLTSSTLVRSCLTYECAGPERPIESNISPCSYLAASKAGSLSPNNNLSSITVRLRPGYPACSLNHTINGRIPTIYTLYHPLVPRCYILFPLPELRLGKKIVSVCSNV